MHRMTPARPRRRGSSRWLACLFLLTPAYGSRLPIFILCSLPSTVKPTLSFLTTLSPSITLGFFREYLRPVQAGFSVSKHTLNSKTTLLTLTQPPFSRSLLPTEAIRPLKSEFNHPLPWPPLFHPSSSLVLKTINSTSFTLYTSSVPALLLSLCTNTPLFQRYHLFRVITQHSQPPFSIIPATGDPHHRPALPSHQGPHRTALPQRLCSCGTTSLSSNLSLTLSTALFWPANRLPFVTTLPLTSILPSSHLTSLQSFTAKLLKELPTNYFYFPTFHSLFNTLPSLLVNPLCQGHLQPPCSRIRYTDSKHICTFPLLETVSAFVFMAAQHPCFALTWLPVSS